MSLGARRDGEKGEGRLGGIITLAVLAAFVYAVWNVAPVYVADYNLRDKMIEIARLGRGMYPDERIMERLMAEVRENRLEDYVTKDSFAITTRDSSRKIIVDYERSAKVLPGWERTFKFHHEVDQPFF